LCSGAKNSLYVNLRAAMDIILGTLQLIVMSMNGLTY